MSAYVLVHGAWHGGWCWDQVTPLLERDGHSVAAPDLPGHGDDRTPAAEVTLPAYVDRVCEALASVDEPAVLVGHSMGGIVISQAAEQCPERVKTLVYLAAFLLPDGQTVGDVMGGNEGSMLPPFVVRGPEQGTSTVKDEGLTDAFYHDCSPEDVAFARARLVPQAAAPAAVPLRLTEARFGSIPRVYIECLQDRAIVPALQRRLYTALPCARVLTLDSSHSPFFSQPAALAAMLMSLA